MVQNLPIEVDEIASFNKIADTGTRQMPSWSGQKGSYWTPQRTQGIKFIHKSNEFNNKGAQGTNLLDI